MLKLKADSTYVNIRRYRNHISMEKTLFLVDTTYKSDLN